MERGSGLHDPVRGLEHPCEHVRVREPSVRDRVQVGEVEDGPHPVEAGGEPEHVLGSPELADAAHDLDAEGDGAAFRLQALPEGGEVLATDSSAASRSRPRR